VSLLSCVRRELFAVDVCAASRKRALEHASEQIAAALTEGPGSEQLFDSLLARERLGSTGLGFGVALPHCRLAGLKAPVVALLRLREPVDFESPDGEPVDLLAVLVVPESAHGEHLALLAALAQLLEPEAHRAALRSAADANALGATLKRLAETG
jgi:PTS system nitrogen regulatory IIA component